MYHPRDGRTWLIIDGVKADGANLREAVAAARKAKP